MQVQKLLFVVNPIAGDIDKQDFCSHLEKVAEKAAYSHEIIYTEGKYDEEKIQEKIASFSPTAVIAVGGDGTCNLVARILENKKIVLGIVPLGSANGLATELGIPSDPHRALEVITEGYCKKVDTLSVNGHLSIHLSDIGLNAKIVEKFEKEEGRGLLGYFKQFFREFKLSKTYKFKFSCDSRVFIQRAIMVTFANASRYGTGGVINPHGEMDDGYFEICIMKPVRWYSLFLMTWRFFRGTLDKSEYIRIIKCKEAEVSCKNPLLLQVDGELIGKEKNVKVRIRRKALRILTVSPDI